MKINRLAFIVGSVVLMGSTAIAQQLGVNFAATSGATGSPWTLGYEFEVTTPVTLVGLATFAPTGAGGLTQDVQVGLWTDDGNGPITSTLIDSATVTAGTLPSADGPFAEVAVTPITLAPGLYDVGSFDTGDYWTGGVSGVTYAPGIEFVQSRYSTGGLGFSYPNNVDEPDSVIAWFGGNIVLAGGSVPDASSTLMLLSVACLALVVVRRKIASA